MDSATNVVFGTGEEVVDGASSARAILSDYSDSSTVAGTSVSFNGSVRVSLCGNNHQFPSGGYSELGINDRVILASDRVASP